MKQNIAHVAVVVNDYDEAIDFYTKKLNFIIVEDTRVSESKRWVIVAPQGSKGCSILLAKAATEEQRTRIGNQTGGRVFLFLHTNNLERDYQDLLKKGITIIREPSDEIYGRVAVFADLYGNLWDLVQPAI